jgi:putative oxidoreductase
MSRNPIGQYEPQTRALFRIVVGGLFMLHGTQKLFGWPGSEPAAVLDPTSMIGIASILEIVGGGAIVIGMLTRVVAFVLAGEMAVAYFMVHAPQSPFPMLNGGEPAVLFCFAFLFLAVAGAGAWSIDAQIAKARLRRHIKIDRRVNGERRTPGSFEPAHAVNRR